MTKRITMMVACCGLFAACSANNYKITTSPVPNNSTNSITPNPSGSPNPVQTPGCTLTNVTIPVKIMFVVDTSGSNNSWTQNSGTNGCTAPNNVGCAPPTDPNKTFRGGSISDFYTKYKAKTNFSWGFETFSNVSATAYIGTNADPTFSDSTAMGAALNYFETQEVDNDATPYLAAIEEVKTAIANDPGVSMSGKSAPLYYVIFMSDGYPTDALNGDGSVDTASLNAAIQSVEALAPGRVAFSTVYYGTINDPVASGVLKGMASGGGVFVNVDTASTSTINIQDLIQVPTGNCN